MKIVVDNVPNCSSDCVFSRYLSCERRRCILTDSICSLDGDVPNKCHKLVSLGNDVGNDMELKNEKLIASISISQEEIEKVFKYVNRKGD